MTTATTPPPRRTPFADRLRLPLVAAPMTAVSGPALVAAACGNGVIGSFPTSNCSSAAEVADWLAEIDRRRPSYGPWSAPVAPNLIVHRSNRRLDDDVEVLVRHGVELVICSVGSPAPVIEPLQRAGCAVWADVASIRHLERAIEVGVDGLVLLTAGAGGQTGWANPLAFARAARARYDGPIALAGGICDGTALRAALALGCDVGYAGTVFIATSESLADGAYRAMVAEATLDDIVLSAEVTGLPASILRASLPAAASAAPEPGFTEDRLHRATTARSAGHTVVGVDGVGTVSQVIERFAAEFGAAALAD